MALAGYTLRYDEAISTSNNDWPAFCRALKHIESFTIYLSRDLRNFPLLSIFPTLILPRGIFPNGSDVAVLLDSNGVPMFARVAQAET